MDMTQPEPCGGGEACPDERPLGEAVAELLARTDELAQSRLEGIEEAARELVEMSDGDVRVVSEARRIAASRLETEPTTHHKQVMSILRRTLEVGMDSWKMEETPPLL